MVLPARCLEDTLTRALSQRRRRCTPPWSAGVVCVSNVHRRNTTNPEEADKSVVPMRRVWPLQFSVQLVLLPSFLPRCLPRSQREGRCVAVVVVVTAVVVVGRVDHG